MLFKTEAKEQLHYQILQYKHSIIKKYKTANTSSFYNSQKDIYPLKKVNIVQLH